MANDDEVFFPGSRSRLLQFESYITHPGIMAIKLDEIHSRFLESDALESRPDLNELRSTFESESANEAGVDRPLVAGSLDIVIERYLPKSLAQLHERTERILDVRINCRANAIENPVEVCHSPHDVKFLAQE